MSRTTHKQFNIENAFKSVNEVESVNCHKIFETNIKRKREYFGAIEMK